MNANVGTIDRVIRLILGAALLSMLFFVEGPQKYFGLTGIILLATAMITWCPIYSLFGINTCGAKPK